MAQKGKCYVTGKTLNVHEMHCHHIIPWEKSHSDKYDNLCLIVDTVHKLLHAETPTTIKKYLLQLNPDEDALERLNNLRVKVGLTIISYQS